MRRSPAAAGGNPLFIGEMLAMAGEEGDEVEVPATLKALLAARLDQLDAGERRVLERGAVEGEVFHRGAVQALGPEETQVTPRLAALVRRELIRPDTAQFAREDGFRFRHLLIRDAAYEALPKSSRAELHELFAGWLETRGEELVELDEILGYHLEQAARYRRELGQPTDAVAERAGVRLAAAGRRALWRGDDRAAAGLLERALELTRPTRLDVVLELDLGQAISDETPQGRSSACRRRRRAGSIGRRRNSRGARPCRCRLLPRLLRGRSGDRRGGVTRARRRCRCSSKPTTTPGLCTSGMPSTMGVFNWRCHYEDYAHAAEQARHHARLAGQRRSDLFRLDSALVYGPRPADEALRTIDALLPDNPHPSVLLERAWLLTMLARFDEAAPSGAMPASGGASSLATTRSTACSATSLRPRAITRPQPSTSAVSATSPRRAASTGFLQTFAPMLGRSLCKLGRHDEAEPLAELGRTLDETGQDVFTQALWRQVQALVHAHRGEHAEAETLAREAVAVLEPTDA